VDEDAQEQHSQPAVDPVHGGQPPDRQQIPAAEREVGAREPGSRVPHVAPHRQLHEQHDEPGAGEPAGPVGAGRDRSGRSAQPESQHDEPTQDQQRVHQVRGADEVRELEQHRDAPEHDLEREQGREQPGEPAQPGRRGASQRGHARGQDQHGGGQRGQAMPVLDEHVGPERRDHRAVAERPVWAREARAGGADHVAEGHEHEDRHDRGEGDPSRHGLPSGSRAPRRRRRPRPASGRRRRRARPGRSFRPGST